jgi:uncharacterized protein with HEPN domain
MDYQAFLGDLKTRDAVIRNLEVIGEASKNIKDDFREQFQEVPWKEMSGVRDKLIHHYFGVNFEVVWTIIQDELPGLKNNLNTILKEESKKEEGKKEEDKKVPDQT